MRSVKPPEAAAALMALLATRQFIKPDLFTFILQSGATLRYTEADVPLTINGHTYASDGPLITRGTTSSGVGLEVDELELKISAAASHLVDGVPFVKAVRTGVFDGAEVIVERAFGPDWTQPLVASVELFSGRVADCSYDNGLTIRAKSFEELLDAQVPRNVIQPPCMNLVYDSRCGVSRAAFTETGTVISGTERSIQTSITNRPDNYFALGLLLFSSGPNAGLLRSVYSDAAGTINFALPLPNEPEPGDIFTVLPGCDRQQSTCQNKFNNIIHFRGQPYVPVPETVSPG